MCEPPEIQEDPAHKPESYFWAAQVTEHRYELVCPVLTDQPAPVEEISTRAAAANGLRDCPGDVRVGVHDPAGERPGQLRCRRVGILVIGGGREKQLRSPA